jgi:hypothetical protein
MTTLRQRQENRNQTVSYQRPLSISPWANKAGVRDSGSVWISMKPTKIVDQFSKGAGTYSTKDLKTEFLFLAPLSLNENIVHNWEAYESVASRLAQKVRSAVKLGSEGTALLGVGKNANPSDFFKGVFSKTGAGEGQVIEKYASKAYNSVPGSKIPKIKVDTPLYYTNSERRQIVLEFQLFYENIPGKSAEDVLIKPIKELMRYSSPDLKGELNIEFPYMWEIKTLPNEFIKYTTTALTGVQPTWNAPYINGVPASCNLQLTFQDLSPLYAATIEKGSIINVITPSQASQVQSSNQEARKKYTATNATNRSQQDVIKGGVGT